MRECRFRVSGSGVRSEALRVCMHILVHGEGVSG